MEKKTAEPIKNAIALICEAQRKASDAIERLQDGEIERAANRLNDAALAFEGAAHAIFAARDAQRLAEAKKESKG